MGMGVTLYPASPSVDAACPRLFNAALLSLLRHRRPHHRYAHPYAASSSSSSSFSSPLYSSSSSSCRSSGSSTRRTRRRGRKGSQSMYADCSTSSKDLEFMDQEQSSSSVDADCLGAGLDAECAVVSSSDSGPKAEALVSVKSDDDDDDDGGKSTTIGMLIEKGVLVSPFFFWGTAMVAMKEVLPILGPFFVASFRLIPAGLILVAFAGSTGRPFPSGPAAWLSISLFGLVDAACFQGFLAEGLQRTSAGLGSVIIDSQPLTVAVLAALLFDESIGIIGAVGLILGIIGLLLLEVPALAFDENNFSLWGSGEWWMLLAAQSMAIGTVMVRWVSKYSDTVMATGWHMVIGGLPLVIISIFNHDPAFSGSLVELKASDIVSLLYTSIFGSAISYGVYFYSATKGSLMTLSSLTFLTPMFASLFGFLYLGETFSPLQLVGAIVTVAGIYLVNLRSSTQ